MSTTQQQKQKLKTDLFTSLNKLGIQDQLKKQIRIQLIQKLKLKDSIKPTSPSSQHENKLYTRILTSLISQQLQISDCTYSNSIYTIQSGYDLKILNRQQILQIMGMVQEDMDSGMSVLSNIMKRKYPFNGNTIRSISVQTNPEDIEYSLEQRLALIDQQYRRNINNGQQGQNKDQIDYKKKLSQNQQNLKHLYQRDLQRFKQFQTHKIKIKISQQWRKKFQQYSYNISQQYRKKMDHLRKKQKLLSDQIINKTKLLDQKTQGAHKTFLQKIDLLQIKTNTISQTKKYLDLQKNRIYQQYQSRQKQLKNKIYEYDNLLLKLNQKINYQVGIAKLAIQQQYQQKNIQFLTRKKYVDQQYGKLMGIKQTIDIIKQQNTRLYEQNTRLRKDMVQLQRQLRISVSQGAGRNQRIDSLRAELSVMEREKNKSQEILRQQVKKNRYRQEEVIQMRRQLDQLRQWKEEQERKKGINNNSSVMMDIDNDGHQIPRKMPQSIVIGMKSEIASKIDSLKAQRLKQIQRLKLQL